MLPSRSIRVYSRAEGTREVNSKQINHVILDLRLVRFRMRNDACGSGSAPREDNRTECPYRGANVSARPRHLANDCFFVIERFVSAAAVVSRAIERVPIIRGSRRNNCCMCTRGVHAQRTTRRATLVAAKIEGKPLPFPLRQTNRRRNRLRGAQTV